ncbi:MAG TPA: type II secretion system protein GspD, partial [Sulfurovum sp.]|nr:type II secretion system protein GspD [Sulfurovum sp.]
MKLNKIILVVMASITLLFGAADEETVNVNFRNLDIKDFVEMVSKISQKNILINGALKGKINFVSTQPIKKSSLIPLANSILANKGFTLIDQGDFMQVVKASEAAGMGLAVDDKISGNTLKTVLFKLKTSNAAVIRAKIKPLLHKNAKVVSFRNNNVLSITAYPRTLKSIKKIIDSVEGAGKKGSTVIKLRHASAKAVHGNAVKMAAQLFPKTIPSEKVDILKDESTNSIILVGKKDNVNQMIRYVKQLDQKGDSVEQKMYVIPLKNSNVEEMEKILSKLLSQMNNLSSKTIKKGGKPATKAMVVGDMERNALIILATGEQMKNIRQVIRSIDIEKPQVYIKVKIVEINTGLAQSVGIRYGFEGGTITSKGLLTLAGSTGAPAISMGTQLLSLLQTTTGTGDDQTTTSKLSDLGNNIFALGATISLLKENGAAKILSEPSVLCTNNQESEIYVGETRSILTSSASGDNKNDIVRNNYSREDIGISLKVKPRLSSHNKVTLTVSAVIEDILPGSSNSTDRPTTTKRKVNTNAIVQSGETIILGGLIKSSSGETTSKVPILGDIPLLGKLFSSTTKGETGVNVVMYITPYIVRKSSDLVKLKKTLNELEGIQSKYNSLIKKKLEENKPYNSKSTTNKSRSAMDILGMGRQHSRQVSTEPEKEIIEYVPVPQALPKKVEIKYEERKRKRKSWAERHPRKRKSKLTN